MLWHVVLILNSKCCICIVGILPVNMFAEKIFIILWFWYLFIMIATVWSMVSWMWKVFPMYNRRKFVKRFLKLGYYTKNWKKENVKKIKIDEFVILNKFLRCHLKIDGAFILYFIELNAGEISAAQIANDMWKIYKIECH